MVDISEQKIDDWIERLSRYEGVYSDNGFLMYQDLEDVLYDLQNIRDEYKRRETARLPQRSSRYRLFDTEICEE